jgi:hypothetical protein
MRQLFVFQLQLPEPAYLVSSDTGSRSISEMLPYFPFFQWRCHD